MIDLTMTGLICDLIGVTLVSSEVYLSQQSEKKNLVRNLVHNLAFDVQEQVKNEEAKARDKVSDEKGGNPSLVDLYVAQNSVYKLADDSLDETLERTKDILRNSSQIWRKEWYRSNKKHVESVFDEMQFEYWPLAEGHDEPEPKIVPLLKELEYRKIRLISLSVGTVLLVVGFALQIADRI